MAGPLDYLRWRGDLSFKEKPFNSVDASLLSSIAYLPADSSATNHTLGEVAEKLRNLSSFQHQMYAETATEVMLLPESPRIGNIKILDWTDRLEKEPHPLQFTAATFLIDTKTIAVVFRGTDGTMIGLNEDMGMNYLPEIYGQEVAAKYLTEIAHKFSDQQIYLLGHSKGGNFAQFALCAVEPEIQKRVIKAISFDGPGFFHKVYTSPGFTSSMSKMKTYIPQNSIFGAMLDHPEQTLVVKSTVPMRNQHDPRRWSVGRDSFTLADGLSSSSRVIRHALINFNNSIPDQERNDAFSDLFEAFENYDIDELNQLTSNKIVGTYRFGRAFLSLEPQERKLLTQVLSNIWNSYKKNMTLPLMASNYDLYPKSNDSNKAPVFYEFYDPDRPNLKLPESIRRKLR
ncbi:MULTISPECIES: DUF2974 domain-containing protein [Lactobacillus]|uniref:Esterase n=1 Tax=Lactobacillus melliventris TaxID=1218507 RepID=A0ABX5N3J8_9LACO|nr:MULTISPECIES: DUF2974 domain-containing protein [Lactobacillus]MBC6349621.1 DUF2974 domain-containing protein [Lactobacillus melliventris]NUE97532.1 DUF2974 domain-containing protein [Lactobacillus melliventris]PXY85986.1 esterase [Lactobacillus melliventris]RMC62290.1 DUF2974 domain-containing protein [Lactobacillus sp. ESL0259]